MAKYQCPDCGYTYDEVAGHLHEGFNPGTPWSQVPESWSCPDCAVRDKFDFVLIDGVPFCDDYVTQRGAGSAFVPSAFPQEGGSAILESIAPFPSRPDTREVSSVLQRQLAPAQVGKEKTPLLVPSVSTVYQKWICITCGHIYDEALGDEREGFAPGTLFSEIPDDWCCPDCGATKEDYVLYEEK
ncbi:rubredoxin [Acidocella facilis]|uniref:rubredoxin n=1 Tax=Acidocella facilis TaxID=525 RepID=UPI0038CF364B